MRGGAPGALAGGGSEPSERGGPPLRPNPPSSPPQTSPAGSPPPRPGVSSEPSALIPQSPCPHACPAQPQLQATARPPTAPARLPTPAGPWVPDSHGSAAAPLGYTVCPPHSFPREGARAEPTGGPVARRSQAQIGTGRPSPRGPTRRAAPRCPPTAASPPALRGGGRPRVLTVPLGPSARPAQAPRRRPDPAADGVRPAGAGAGAVLQPG